MPQGHGANFAEVIEEKDMAMFGKVGLALGTLKATLKYHDLDFDQFAEHVSREDWDGFRTTNDISQDVAKKIRAKLAKVCQEFKAATGLEIQLSYHDQDQEGDEYDEVSGPFWQVHGMYMLTPAGRNIADVVQRKFFVTVG